MLDLRLLSHALALAEHGSFARAARAVNLSQPALSRGIQALESQLGMVLFERGKRGVRPTDAGQLVLNRARALSLQSEDLEREVGALRKGGGVGLRVATGPYAARLLVGRTLGLCLQRTPEFRATLAMDSFPKVIRMVEEREADLGICEGSDLKAPELESLPLRRRQGHAVARPGHPLAGRLQLTIEDLLDFPLVFTTRLPSRMLANLLPPGARHGTPAIRCECLQVAMDVVSSSDAIAFFVEPMIREKVATGTLTKLAFSPEWLHSEFHLIWLRDRVMSPAAGVFRDTLIEVDNFIDA